MKLRKLLLVSVALFASARAAPLSVPPTVPQLFSFPLPAAGSASALHFANGAEMLGDITYETIPGYRPLKLDVYVPSAVKPARPLPLVIWVHGGGWEIGNPRADWTYGDWTQVLARLSARGYIVAGVSYRFSLEAPFPAQIDDVHAAIRFLRQNASEWGIDPNRVYIWGLSAGGHLAALAGTESATEPADLRVQGVVDWFGPTDLSGLKPSPGLSALLHCPASGCSEAALAAASPVTYVSAEAPPTLIMQGGADPLVHPAQSQELYDRLKAVGVQAQLLIFPGLGHGFTGASKDKLEEILRTTFAYLDRLSGK